MTAPDRCQPASAGRAGANWAIEAAFAAAISSAVAAPEASVALAHASTDYRENSRGRTDRAAAG